MSEEEGFRRWGTLRSARVCSPGEHRDDAANADGSEGWAGTQPEAISSPSVSAIPESPGFNDPPDLVLSFPPNICRLGT
jgi:hypothetical protein